MSDWIGANWIWILLGIGVLWFMFRRGGMGCGMGGHGTHDHSEPSEKEFPPGGAASSVDHEHEADVKEPAAATHRPRRHGGCC